MKHGETMFTTILFLTVQDIGVQSADLMGLHGDLKLQPQDYPTDPIMAHASDGNAWVWARPKWALRQGDAITGHTVGTTKEHYYVPYWPEGHWVFERPMGHVTYCPLIAEKYGPVCGRKHNWDWVKDAIYVSFKNLCELQKANWASDVNRYYPVHMSKCRNGGEWTHMVTVAEEIVKRKRQFENLVWKRTLKTTIVKGYPGK